MTSSAPALLNNQTREREAFLDDVLIGLSEKNKWLPCKYFYDRIGSKLFDKICGLDEYYPTRTEASIMESFADQMGQQIGPEVMLIEYGSGSSTKTRILLDALSDPIAYVPVDISRDHLHQTARQLAVDYPLMDVLPVCADFTQSFELPHACRDASHVAVYFPGSTIGNFEPAEAQRLLQRITDMCGLGGGLLIGIDLQKDIHVLQAAYDDRDGITAEFNLNLLRRINRELGADFELDQFQHSAVYNSEAGRIEMRVVSLVDQNVTLGTHTFHLKQGETIHTESSHKYTIQGFADLASHAGLTLRRYWSDPNEYFAVMHLAVLDDV